MSKINIPSRVSGYAITDDYFAQRSHQGGRVHYSIVLPLHQVPVTLPVPDPNQPFEDNRQVVLSHAESFADYIRENSGWHAGPLTVRGLSSELRFEELGGQSAGPVMLGILSVPRNMRTAFRIIDGQHRILGVKILLESVGQDIVDATSRLANARRNGEEKAMISELERQLKKLEELKTRIENDTMMVDLVVVDDEVTHKQIFIDVANNALSVQKAVTVRFDTKKKVNRAVMDLLSDVNTDILIKGRIDEQKDRVAGQNPNLLGSGKLADIVRELRKGVLGRFSAQDEETIDHKSLVRDTNEFFAVLRTSFKPLEAIASGKSTPAELRGTHLVMSVTMMRILAGVFHELRKSDVQPTEITEFFKTIDRAGATPLSRKTAYGKMWIDADTGAFVEDENAPGSRSQVIRAAVELITGWFTNPPATLGWKGSK